LVRISRRSLACRAACRSGSRSSYLLAIGLALTVMIGGSGALSFDRALSADDR
jgi:hypothetical protein